MARSDVREGFDLSDEQLLELVEVVDSVSLPAIPAGTGRLTDQQRRFAHLYVLTRGNGARAARLAGYLHPDVQGTKLTLHPVVSELIKTLALASATTALPVAVGVLVELANDPNVDARTRRQCALDLAKIAGAMPKAAPAVAVQVNAGAAGDGAPVAAPSVVIQNVWNRREQRELSSIPASMPDALPPPDDSAASDGLDDGQGG